MEQRMKKVLEITNNHRQITDDQLKTELAAFYTLTERERVQLLGELQNMGYLNVEKNVKGEITYSYQNPADGKKLGKLDNNDRILYKLILESESKGITKEHLRSKTGMNQKQINSSLKSLDKVGLIKSFKAKDKGKLIFLSSNYDPDEEIVGGALYENGQVNSKLIEVIKSQILGILETRPVVPYNHLLGSLVENSSEAASLKEGDIKLILNSMVFDDLIEDRSNLGKPEYAATRLNKGPANKLGFDSFPCFFCPVYHECKPGSHISPEKCAYFEEW